MKKLENILKENMHRFNTKNINESSLQVRPDADNLAYDLILNIMDTICLNLDLTEIQDAIESPTAGNDYYETITKKIIPVIKQIVHEIQEESDYNTI